MSALRKCLAPVVAAWVVFAVLVMGSPAGQATPGAGPAPAADPTNKNDEKDDHYRRAKESDGSVTVKGRRRSTAKPSAPTKPESSSSEPQEPSLEQKRIDGLRVYIEIACHPEHPMTDGYVSCEKAKAMLAEMLKQQAKQPTQPVLPEQVIAQQAVATLTLPEVNPVVMPDPEWNRWKSYAVGEDLWLWADSPAQLSTTVTQQGITIQITAVRDRVVFDMGNGDKVSCKSMTKYYPPPDMDDEPWESPDCGYYYERLPQQRCVGYTMTATAHWTVTWAVLGKTGTIPVTKTATKHLPIVELHSLSVPTTHDPNDYDEDEDYNEYDDPDSDDDYDDDEYDDPNEPVSNTSACPRRTSTPPTPAPTSQPAPTSKPAQTSKPAPTSQPAPTSKPAQTSKPARTRKPGSKPS